MSQHTPGPWIAQEYQDGIRIIGRAAIVATVPNEQVEDARLIAKAPEMHVKLARALVALSKYDYGLADSISLDVFETWQEIDRIAEEAI